VATSPRRMRSVTNFSPPLIVSSVCIRHSTNQEQSRKAALNDMYPQRGQSLHQLAQSSRLLMPFWPTGRLPLSCVKQPDRPPFVKLQAPTIGLLPETISFRNESIIVERGVYGPVLVRFTSVRPPAARKVQEAHKSRRTAVGGTSGEESGGGQKSSVRPGPENGLWKHAKRSLKNGTFVPISQ
jgi:hypothetical protein